MAIALLVLLLGFALLIPISLGTSKRFALSIVAISFLFGLATQGLVALLAGIVIALCGLTIGSLLRTPIHRRLKQTPTWWIERYLAVGVEASSETDESFNDLLLTLFMKTNTVAWDMTRWRRSFIKCGAPIPKILLLSETQVAAFEKSDKLDRSRVAALQILEDLNGLTNASVIDDAAVIDIAKQDWRTSVNHLLSDFTPPFGYFSLPSHRRL